METRLRLRVYVGADHRARVVGWEEELDIVVAQASAMLTRSAGIALEVHEAVGWPRSGGPLAKTLSALVASDPGTDVDVVLGLVDAVDRAETNVSKLVAAKAPGHHLVVRSFSWQSEGAALPIEGLSENARERLLIARRRHKQSVLLAHGISELFGEFAPFGPQYRSDIDEFPGEVGARLGPAAATALATRKAAPTGRATDGSEGLRRVDNETLAQVDLLLEADKPGVAWELLEPLLELYPKHADIAAMGCRVAEARLADDRVTRCKTAIALGAKSAQAHLAIAVALASSGENVSESSYEEALEHLTRAEAASAAGDDAWAEIAKTYQKLSLPSLAARAAKASGNVPKVAKWARARQVRYGADVGVAPTAEGRYLRALEAGLRHVYAARTRDAQASVRFLEESFPKSIGASLLRCELAMHTSKYAVAIRECGEVRTRHPESSWARYLLGVAHSRQKRNSDAIPYLEEAIARDAELEAAYKALAQLYRAAGDKRLAALRATYQSVFGKAL